MSARREKGSGDNPWVRKNEPEEEAAASDEPELPPSPWSLEVPPAPSPWNTAGPEAGPAPAESGWDEGGAGGPARETSSAWGDQVGPPSLRRPPPEKKSSKLPPVVLPIAAGLLVVILVAVVLVLLSGGDKPEADPPAQSPSPSGSPSTPATTYSPPPNAIQVGFNVSVVPVAGWELLTTEQNGKQLVAYAPNRTPRAFFWVRQKQNVTAQAFLVGIVEGETDKEIAQLGNVRNLPCPKDVLVECVAIDYTSTKDGVQVKGFVQAYRRKDNVVTALDFRTRTDFAPKAEADAEPMKKSVVDSL